MPTLLLLAWVLATPAPDCPPPAAGQRAPGIYPGDALTPGQLVLTFDASPRARFTGGVLDLLKQYEAPATFFVVGRRITRETAGLLRRAVAEGHTLGSLTYSADVGFLRRSRGSALVEAIYRDHRMAELLVDLALRAEDADRFEALHQQVVGTGSLQRPPWAQLEARWPEIEARWRALGAPVTRLYYARPPGGAPYFGRWGEGLETSYGEALGRLGMLNVLWHGGTGEADPGRPLSLRKSVSFLAGNLVRRARRGGVITIQEWIPIDALAEGLRRVSADPRLRVVPLAWVAGCTPSRSGPPTSAEPAVATTVEPHPAAAQAPAAEPPPAPDPEPVAEPEPVPGAPGEPDLSGFASLRADPPPEELTKGRHYWTSNEYRHDLFRPVVEGLGGIYVGVGTDQNYLIAGWMRPEVLVAMDFDGLIPELHGIYGLVFAAAATPREFLGYWLRGKGIERLVAEAHPEDPRRVKALLRVLSNARWRVRRRLRWTKETFRELKVPTFLTDQRQYDHIRELFARGRVFAIRGDLTGDKTVRDIAAAARRAGLPVRALYTSNAEDYFRYGDAFRRNIAALPFDEKGVVLQTSGRGGHSKIDGHYHYVWQYGRDFQGWLARPEIGRIHDLIRRHAKRLGKGRSRILRPPG